MSQLLRLFKFLAKCYNNDVGEYMKLELITFKNYKEAIKIQNTIFPHENGTLNILASLDRDLFTEKTNLFYPDDKVKYYLAYIEEKIIGMTGMYIEGNNEAWLGWFGILPELRNQGYGKLLLEETIKLAKNNGHKVLRLYTDKKANATAIKLYEKLGFTGEKYSFEKLDYDCWIYSKNLCNEELKLWNNKNLNLLWQSGLDQMDKQSIDKVVNMYDKLNRY